jgi:hypothetical protein
MCRDESKIIPDDVWQDVEHKLGDVVQGARALHPRLQIAHGHLKTVDPRAALHVHRLQHAHPGLQVVGPEFRAPRPRQPAQAGVPVAGTFQTLSRHLNSQILCLLSVFLRNFLKHFQYFSILFLLRVDRF